MRRVKDSKGQPKPITPEDVAELERFKDFLVSISRRKAQGQEPREATVGALVEVYPEDPNARH